MKKSNTCIQSFYISILFKIFFLIVCGYGLCLHISPMNITYNIHMFSYFTVLSNTLCFIVTFISIFKTIKNKVISIKKHTLYNPLPIYTKSYSYFHGMTLMGIILTFFIYHFMVAKYKYPLLYNNILCLPTKDLFAHYLVPLLYTFDWLLFHPKNLNTVKSPLYWLLYPIIYLITIMFRGFCLPKKSLLYLEKFPYFFLGIKDLGPTLFAIYMVLILFVILIIGYTIIGIEKLFCFIDNRRR